jgi:glycine oxidase
LPISNRRWRGGSARLDPRRAIAALEAALAASGVRFAFGVEHGPDGNGRDPLDARDCEEGFDHVVDCTGASALGAVKELRAVRGEMLYLASEEVTLSRPVRLLHPRHPIYLVPRGHGLFMLGATMIESASEGPITARSLMELLNSAYALHPAFGEAAVVETGTGLRPAFPDNYPRVQRKGRRILVNGMYRHGFLLAPAMAQAVVDEVGSG